jgi:hypothetical protein
MKKLLTYTLIAILFTSCLESFKTIDPTEFNKQISSRVDINHCDELIKLYYNNPEFNSSSKLKTIAKTSNEIDFEITLTHEGLEDDSQAAIKIVMSAKHTSNKWIVQSIKENWKCWRGRGHTNWDTRPCN